MTAKTRARTDSGVSGPGFSGSVPLRLLRWLLVVWLAVDLAVTFVVDLGVSSSAGWEYGVAATAVIAVVILATYRPRLAIVVSIIPLLSSHLIGNFGQEIPLLIAIPIAACAVLPPPLIALTLGVYLTHAAAFGLLHSNSFISTMNVGIVVCSTALGLVIRGIRRRQHSVGARIRDVERAAAELREAERAALADELSTLLARGLSTERHRVTEARRLADPADLARALDEAARAARDALGQLRRLVTTLRGRDEAHLSTSTAADLVAVAEEADELLTGHGHDVELDVGRMARPPGAFAQRLLADVLREGALMAIDEAAPGASGRIIVSSNADETLVELSFDGASFWETGPLSEARRRLQLTGGSLVVDDLTLRAVLPTQPAPDVVPDPEAGQAISLPRWDKERVLRWAGTLPALALASYTAVLAVRALPASSYDGTNLGLWSWTFLALAVVCWRPIWAIAPLLVAVVVPLFTREPTVTFSQPNVAFITLAGILVSRATWWGWVTTAAAVGYVVLWFRGIVPTSFLSAFMVAILGVLVGLTGQHFRQVRAQQHARFGRAVEQRLRARDDVRRELAGELHDIVAHQLTLITLSAGANRGDALTLREALGRVEAILQSTQVDLALLLHLLRPSARAGAAAETEAVATPLAAADAAAATLRESGRNLAVTADPAVDEADPTTRRTLTRIIREATTNILRYAPEQAHCTLDLVSDDDRIRIRAASPLPSLPIRSADSTGLGLVGLEERVRLTGGTLTARVETGMWVVEAHLPVAPTHALRTRKERQTPERKP